MSNGGRKFYEIAESAKKWSIELRCTASVSLWGNGKCEKVVRQLKETLQKLKEDDGVKKNNMG